MAKPKGNKRAKSLTNIKSALKKAPSTAQNHQPKPKPISTPQGFKFISNDYSAHLQCPLCQQLMIRPMRVHPCGHTFCQKCIELYMLDTKWLCPFTNCLRKFQLIQNDRTAENLIDELKVQCTNEGCVYKGVYDNYKKVHKDTCKFKNGGIDAWLGNLTQGIVFTQRTQQSDDLEDSQSYSKKIRRSQTLQPLIEENFSQYSQNVQNADYHKNAYDQEKKQVSYKQTEDLYAINCRNEEEKEEKQQEKSTSNPHSLQNSISSSSGMDLNFSIFNIPFGPSIREQIQSSERKRDRYLQKEIKKVQG